MRKSRFSEEQIIHALKEHEAGTKFAGLPGIVKRLDCAAGSEDAVRIVHADDLVHLHQIDMIGLEPLERLLDLMGGGLLITPIDFGHQENLLPVAISQGFAHTHFAVAVVIIPAVVHEVDAVVDGRANEANSLGIVLWIPDVIPAQPDNRDLLAGAAEYAVLHRVLGVGRFRRPCGDDSQILEKLSASLPQGTPPAPILTKRGYCSGEEQCLRIRD